jgi:WD40 repeat protein
MLFSQLKQFLQIILADQAVVTKNVVLQNTSYATALSNVIGALTPDLNIRLDSTAVASSTGLLVSDSNRRELRFDPKGSDKIVQGFLEANVSNVVKIWQRSDDAAGTQTSVPYGTLSDGRRYYVTDADRGVFYLNEYGHIIGAVPGNAILTGSGYGSASSAITFQITATEYVAVASTDHMVRIYNASTFALVSTIGTPGSAGLPDAVGSPLLDTPTDLAFDSVTNTLYISCAQGIAASAGGTGNGFVCSFDLTIPAAPVFGSYIVVNQGTDLHQMSVALPQGLAFDPTLGALWVLSYDSTNIARPYEIGAVSVTGLVSDGYLVGYVEFRGRSFATRTAQKIHVDVGRRRLYLTNSPGVEVFDLVTMKHLYTFGSYSQDENSANPNSGKFSPVTGAVSAVAADVLSVDGVLINFALFADSTNNRIVRVGENIYEGENVITFNSATYAIPVSLHGYLVKGDLATDKIQVEYRTSSTGAWQILSQTDSVSASTFFQFRLKVNPDLSDVIAERAIKEIVIVGRQEG